MAMENSEAEQLKTAYLERLRRMLRHAPAEVRDDALREVKAHIEDEWQALGGDIPALEDALQRLGPPEAYGRDLALQLLLLRGTAPRSPWRLALAILFWASSSLLGSVVILCAALAVLFGLGMLVVAMARLGGSASAYLIHMQGGSVFGQYIERYVFPPDAWSPILVVLLGMLPPSLILAGLYRFYMQWVRSRLVAHGLEMVVDQRPLALSKGWERQAVLAMTFFAILGLTGCIMLASISNLVPFGHYGKLSLPEDFLKTPLTFLAFLSGLIFLCAPVLGLLWATRKAKRLRS